MQLCVYNGFVIMRCKFYFVAIDSAQEVYYEL